MALKVLVWAASARTGSYNRAVGERVAAMLKEAGHIPTLRSFKEDPLPLYDGDTEEAGLPKAVELWAQAIDQAQALVVVTPEYNGSIPAPLKNALDWISRRDEVPFKGKPCLLIASSPGALGGVRGLWHTRVPFEALGTLVYPTMVGISRVPQELETAGAVEKKIQPVLNAFLEFTSKLASS